MKEKIRAGWLETVRLFRSIPPVTVTLFTLSVVLMNLLANKTVYQSGTFALDGGIAVSWLSFLCMDVVTKAFGPKAATRLSVFALVVNLFACGIFKLVSLIPSETDYEAFNTIFGGTWFILLSSSAAFLVSSVVNNYLNRAVGRLFRKKPDGLPAFLARSYVSTFIGQFLDNLTFALLTFTVFAPIFWDGFRWTYTACLTCSLFGAAFELLAEAVFAPFGYRIVKRWAAEGIGGADGKEKTA